MIEPQSKEIDGVTFKYTPMMAGKARELLDKLIQRFGSPLGKMVEALDRAEDLTLNTDTGAALRTMGQMAAPVGVGIQGLTAQLDPAFHKDLVATLARQTQVLDPSTGNETMLTADIETRFATSLMTEAKWIGFCLECQYADFLEWFKSSALNALAAKALANTPASASPQASTGGSSASQQASGIPAA